MSYTQEFYQIRVKGHLSPQLAEWFDGLAVTNERDGNALLSGFIVDQAALYGVLLKMHNLGLTLLSVNHVEPYRRGSPASLREGESCIS